MKLQTRLTALVTIFVFIVSVSIGIFAIKTTEKIQYQRIDERLSLIISELKNSNDDQLALASLLSEESNNKFSVAYLSAERDLTTINESAADLSSVPTEAELKLSLYRAINFIQDQNLRIRSISLPDDQFIILSVTISEITETTNSIIKYLIIFTLIMLFFSFLFSSILFKKDNELNKLVTSLQNNQERMKTFLGDASHELRTPLTVIKGYFDLMRKKQIQNQSLSQEQLSRIDSEVNRMSAIISDLLFITELDQTKDEPKSPIDLSELISEHISDLRALQPERVVNIKIHRGLILDTSRKYLEQIFNNIFSNLKRHTPSNSPVTIELKESMGRIVFEIEDSGPGLPKDFYQNGIQAFQRFDRSRSRETGGSGLGMTIISKSIEKIGAKIILSPSHDGGVKISITFN